MSRTFGPHLRALVLTLAYAGGMSEHKILELVHSTGIEISAGTLSNPSLRSRTGSVDREPRGVRRINDRRLLNGIFHGLLIITFKHAASVQSEPGSNSKQISV